jgi:thioester reductase-like protein
VGNSNKNHKKTVLLTGTTGLIGSYLLKVLLQNGCKVYAVSRSKDGKSARDRVIDVLKFWDKDVLFRKSRNLLVFEGDITKKNLGLNKQSINLLKDEIEEIFHCAALTQFNLPLKEIRKVNVEGTRNVLELALKCKKNGRLKKLNHISTAYVCGDYKGIFKEDDLDVEQKFNSTYEQSKFEAEKLVEKYRKKGLWIDIFRPPLVVGESVTGKTITFQQSVYQLLHIWNLEIFDCFPGEGYSVNIVFVDDLCKAIFKISLNNEILRFTQNDILGANYHTFNCSTVSFEDILDASSRFLGFQKPRLVTRDVFNKNKLTPAQKMLLQNNILLFNNNAKLDSRTTNRLLKQYGFEFSDFNRDSFLKLLEYCVKKGFLKKLKKN